MVCLTSKLLVISIFGLIVVRGKSISKRLDRALDDWDWHHSFLEAYVENLCRLYLDHSPILLRLMVGQRIEWIALSVFRWLGCFMRTMMI